VNAVSAADFLEMKNEIKDSKRPRKDMFRLVLSIVTRCKSFDASFPQLRDDLQRYS
jgi:hypothetical protein